MPYRCAFAPIINYSLEKWAWPGRRIGSRQIGSRRTGAQPAERAVMSGRRAQALVADSGAFIKGVPVHEWSEKVITVREVMNEIRDYNTRQRLRLLPYKFRG